MKLNLPKIVLTFILSTFSLSAFAWQHSVEIGYGYSHDPNNIYYHNSGVMLSGDIYALRRTPTTFWSITGSLGQWHTTAPYYQNLTTLAASLALRLYFPWQVVNAYPTYFLASFGPALLSSRHFGVNTQAANVTIQSNLGLGVEFNPIDINLRLEHFSNAGLGKPNEGFNILYLLSVGYLFG